MKVQFLAPELETNYFWNDFVINSTQTNAETTIYIDEQNSQVKGKFRCRIVFHDETLNSLTMHPGKLTRTPILKVYLKRETELTAIDRLKQIKKWLAAEKKNIEDEALLKTGKQVEIQGNWANLTLDVLAMQESVQSVHFEVARNLFRLLFRRNPFRHSKIQKRLFLHFDQLVSLPIAAARQKEYRWNKT